MYITKRQRVVKSPQQIPLPPDEDSADTILQDAKRAFYESGAANFEEARRYYATLNADFKTYNERMVMDSMNLWTPLNDDGYIERQNYYEMYYWLGLELAVFSSLNVPTI